MESSSAILCMKDRSVSHPLSSHIAHQKQGDQCDPNHFTFCLTVYKSHDEHAFKGPWQCSKYFIERLNSCGYLRHQHMFVVVIIILNDLFYFPLQLCNPLCATCNQVPLPYQWHSNALTLTEARLRYMQSVVDLMPNTRMHIDWKHHQKKNHKLNRLLTAIF